MSDYVSVILDSPLMYIVVGVVLTFFTEWRLRALAKKMKKSVDLMKLAREFGQGLGYAIREMVEDADRNGTFDKILKRIIKILVEAYLDSRKE